MPEFWEQILVILPYATIPLVSAIVGWGTNVIALKMTFYPLNFIGIGPIGWQGIIPSKAKKMAGISVDLMTTKLVNTKDVFAQIDPFIVAQEMEISLMNLTQEILDEAMEAQMPLVWKRLPEYAKKKVHDRVSEILPKAIEEMMQDVKLNISELLNLKALAIDTLMEDKNLINQIFLNVGDKEFRFIERSGLYFGFLFGLVQMAVFVFYSPWWILPLFGLLVGYATNYLALKLIFNPINPKKILFWTFQGIFLTRQEAVAKEYAKIIAERILTTEKLFDYILRGPDKHYFSQILKKHVDQSLDTLTQVSESFYTWLKKSGKLQILKNITHYKLLEELPLYIREVYNYAEYALDIKNLLGSKMAGLSNEEFVNFLRPVFQEDEMKLIIVGAFLGALAGIAQFLLFFQ